MVDLRIQSAICAPLVIEGKVDVFLYLDTRGGESRLPDDALSFCNALAQLGAATTARLRSAEVAARREQMERDIDAARRAQQMLMPDRTGSFRGLTYAFQSLAGRFVAGDLFDILELPDQRTAFFLGDVSGKGAGAGVVMAATQTYLRALLAQSTSVADALTELNRHVSGRTEVGTFVTLIAGVFDPRSGRAEIADAGHGFCCRCMPDGRSERPSLDGGVPIGVIDDFVYESQVIELPVGARLQLFSDGVVEQQDGDGTEFGFDTAIEVLARSGKPDDDVSQLLAAVERHANGPFADDITVVALQAVAVP
jgi:sigma-B regulation protein RsbU (phosphoserine phosphatase)